MRAVEVWLGFELRGWLAIATAPIHWAIFASFARGYWLLRPWVWPWAAVYAEYVAVSHLIWNVTSPHGGGLRDGLVQLAVFSIPAAALLAARPPLAGWKTTPEGGTVGAQREDSSP